MLTLTRSNRNMISSSSPTPSPLPFAFISNLKGCDMVVAVVEIAKVCYVET